MKLAALCCTFRRPHTLGQLVESFLRQDYPAELRELVILDDAGQYDNQSGDGWRLVSIPTRFRSLGEKRNACAALASPDVDGFLVADDDDIYLPHWFRATADALSQAEWSRPRIRTGDCEVMNTPNCSPPTIASQIAASLIGTDGVNPRRGLANAMIFPSLA